MCIYVQVLPTFNPTFIFGCIYFKVKPSVFIIVPPTRVSCICIQYIHVCNIFQLQLKQKLNNTVSPRMFSWVYILCLFFFIHKPHNTNKNTNFKGIPMYIPQVGILYQHIKHNLKNTNLNLKISRNEMKHTKRVYIIHT